MHGLKAANRAHLIRGSNMNTFLPLPSYIQSARSLDDKRLNKQKVECLQIYNAISLTRFRTDGTIMGPAKGWINHPAVKMWKKYPHQFLVYSLAVCKACRDRGIRDVAGMEDFFFSRLSKHVDIIPHWIADEKLLEKVNFSHRCNLVRKDMTFYREKFPDVNVIDALFYEFFWPV